MPKDNPFSDNPFGTAQDDPFAVCAWSRGIPGRFRAAPQDKACIEVAKPASVHTGRSCS